MALYRPPNYCPRCGEHIEAIYLNQSDIPQMQRLIGDTFLGYENHVCKSDNPKEKMESETEEQFTERIKHIYF